MPNLLPESAPFAPAQLAWLNGFLSATLGLNNGSAPTNGSAPALPQNGSAPAPIETAKVEAKPVEPKIEIKPAEAKVEAKAAPTYNREHPFPARVLRVTQLTGPDSAKDVRAIALDLAGSGLKYEVGDALGIYPSNCDELVEGLLEALGATGHEPVVTPESRVVPARIALSMAYDITRVGESFLTLLADNAADEEEAKRLRALADDDAEDWLAGRDVVDVLHHFQSSQAAPAEMIASLQPLQPRLYSIASSQRAHPDEVHLTVGVVRYLANDRARKGVASTFLADRVSVAPGQRVGVFVHPAPGFRLPENLNTPVMMVGPGTGIAPFRAFLQDRRAQKATGKNWLFFGDQHAHCDFLYRQELEEHLTDGSLVRLDTAFSRDQAEKIYVQTRMLEHAREIWAWLEEGAHFYVCGDAKRMAKDVDNALRQIVQEQGGMDEGAARAFVQDLTKTRRYQRDVY